MGNYHPLSDYMLGVKDLQGEARKRYSWEGPCPSVQARPENHSDLGTLQQRPTQPLIKGWHQPRQDQRPTEDALPWKWHTDYIGFVNLPLPGYL